MACPDENELIRFSRGALTPPDVSKLETHLGGCAECRRVIAAVALASGALPESDANALALGPGSRLGRFEIERTLGSGAMGVVYAARDTQLGRTVAVKVIHPALPGSLAPEEARARILREAQSMAKLSHPNVISVFDIAPHRDGLFVAMELSDGVTLDVWRAVAKPSVREILRVFEQAGRGLAAAHKAGIVHRDFKPQNVLIDRDGRVRVTDFGLARLEDIADAVDAKPATDAAIASAEANLATRTGLLLGTPGYMAPEQFEGRADARSDQFAFAVALYEALAGTRPFRGDTLPLLREALERCALPPRPREIPASVRRVLARALSNNPTGRFESMDALLVALERATSPSRRARLIAGGVVAFVLAGVIGGVVHERDLAAPSSSPQQVSLGAGERLTLSVPHLSRLAIGDTSIAQATPEGDDKVSVLGVGAGTTSLLAWDDAGSRREWTIRVTSASHPSASDDAAMIRFRPGERRKLEIGNVERAAIGDPSLADIKVSADGKTIDIVALARGTTTLLIWKSGGARRSYLLRISDFASLANSAK